jgi:translation initiation factor 2 beta subunit (eIF-2beta)/eIF-5
MSYYKPSKPCKSEAIGYKTAKKMREFSMWQRDVTKYDQYMRKMLAIREFRDIPLEVWDDLLESDYAKFIQMAAKVGTVFYTACVKTEAIKNAMALYANAYMKLHEIESFETTRQIINAILEEEEELMSKAIQERKHIPQIIANAVHYIIPEFRMMSQSTCSVPSGVLARCDM